MSSGPKRTHQQRSLDMATIEHWCIQGKTVRQMAELLAATRPYRISFQQIHNDLKRIENEWIARAQKDIGAVKAKELRGLDAQEAELWAAWEKSKLDAERSTREKIEGGTAGGGRLKDSLVREGQCGDGTYQRLILEVRDRRAKLLGLDAPAKTQLTGADGGPLQVATAKPICILEPNGFEGPGAPRTKEDVEATEEAIKQKQPEAEATCQPNQPSAPK